ncbi:MAG: energy transducer TonB [Candidatus Palauibacterales bacterium]|nr:energy transducer TonB [Candidatus Palauibacterales bacterium]
MTFDHQQPVRSRRRGFRRLLVRALAVSVLLHVAVLLLWRVEPPPPPGTTAAAGAAPSPSPPPDEAMRAVEIARPAAETDDEEGRPVAVRLPEREPPTVSEPLSDRPSLALERVSAAAAGSRRLAMAAGGEGASSGGEGTGSPGEPGRISPPVPRSLLPQWDPPPEVRGTRVTVRVEVGRDGRPTGQVRLEPPTDDEDFNRRLRETLTSLRYSPGTRAGEPVVAWAEITFVF